MGKTIKQIKIAKYDIPENQYAYYEVKAGGFASLTEGGINTYLSTAKIHTLLNDIDTFEKIIQDKNWPVSQIIQREIDDSRIDEISKTYILQEGNIKYFPPLTIVLLPRTKADTISDNFIEANTINENEKQSILKIFKTIFSGNLDEDIMSLFDESTITIKAEGLFLVEVNAAFNYNLLIWDKSKYIAVTIDGQHRLMALNKSIKLKKTVENYNQDIIFIDVSDKTINSVKTPIEVVRNIFIDINSKANPVSNIRQYLMDDKDLASLFVQEIVNDYDKDNNREGKYIYPQLIDWHSNNLKHELPHITSILVLYQLMYDYVIRDNIVKIDDLRSPKKLEKWINRLNTRFLVDEKIKTMTRYSYRTLESSLKNYIKETKAKNDASNDNDEDKESLIFEYDYNILKVVRDTFSEAYVESIVKFFHELKPYKTCITYYQKANVFDNRYLVNKALIKQTKKMTSNEKDSIQTLKTSYQKYIGDKYDLIYTVLGQKALFYLYFEEIDKNIHNTITNKRVTKITDNFLKKINNLFDVIDNSNIKLFSLQNRVKIPKQQIKKLGLDNKYGTHVYDFWENIIFFDKNIIYNSRGVKSLAEVFKFMLNYLEIEKKDVSLDDFNIPYLSSNIKKRLLNEFDLNLEEAEKYADSIIELKYNYLITVLKSGLK